MFEDSTNDELHLWIKRTLQKKDVSAVPRIIKKTLSSEDNYRDGPDLCTRSGG